MKDFTIFPYIFNPPKSSLPLTSKLPNKVSKTVTTPKPKLAQQKSNKNLSKHMTKKQQTSQQHKHETKPRRGRKKRAENK